MVGYPALERLTPECTSQAQSAVMAAITNNSSTLRYFYAPETYFTPTQLRPLTTSTTLEEVTLCEIGMRGDDERNDDTAWQSIVGIMSAFAHQCRRLRVFRVSESVTADELLRAGLPLLKEAFCSKRP